MKDNINLQKENIDACYKKNKDLIPLIARTIKAYEPNNIILIGYDSDYNVARFTKYLIEIYYKVPVSIASPSVYLEYDSNMEMNKTLAIAFSSSGYDDNIKTVLNKLNCSGALTLSITNNEDSPVAIESKYDLYNCNTSTNYQMISNTFITSIYIIIKLVYEITSIPELDIEENRIIENISESLNYINDIKNDVRNFANDTIVLSYGYTSSIAEEFSLLNLKYSCKNFNNFNLDNILLNNIELKNKNIVLFGIDKFTYGNITNALKKFKENNCNIYVITNKGDIYNCIENGIYINEDNDLYAMFAAIGIIQIIAYEIKNS